MLQATALERVVVRQGAGVADLYHAQVIEPALKPREGVEGIALEHLRSALDERSFGD